MIVLKLSVNMWFSVSFFLEVYEIGLEMFFKVLVLIGEWMIWCIYFEYDG